MKNRKKGRDIPPLIYQGQKKRGVYSEWALIKEEKDGNYLLGKERCETAEKKKGPFPKKERKFLGIVAIDRGGLHTQEDRREEEFLRILPRPY